MPQRSGNTRGQTQLANPTYQVYASHTQSLFQSSRQHSWTDTISRSDYSQDLINTGHTQSDCSNYKVNTSHTIPKTKPTLVTHNQIVPKPKSTLVTDTQTVPKARSTLVTDNPASQAAPKNISTLVKQTSNQQVRWHQQHFHHLLK